MNAGPFQNQSDSDLRIEALRQAVELWKHWENLGCPVDDETISGVAEKFFRFLTGQPSEAAA